MYNSFVNNLLTMGGDKSVYVDEKEQELFSNN